MMHKAWCSIGEVPYCFPRSSSKFQGHKGQKIADFDPNWAFPECNFSLNSPMDLKWYTKLAWCSIEELPYYISRSYIKFQGHTGWKIDDLDQIWTRLLGRSQLSNPSDLPCSRIRLVLMEKLLDKNIITLWPLENLSKVNIFFSFSSVMSGWGISCEMALKWWSLDFIDGKSLPEPGHTPSLGVCRCRDILILTWIKQIEGLPSYVSYKSGLRHLK